MIEELDDAASKRPPPLLGEHTEEVLDQILKMSTQEILDLEKSGAIECWRRPLKYREKESAEPY